MTHFVTWSQLDDTGVGCVYSSQHMAHRQAQQVMRVKELEGASRIRIQRI